MPRDSATTDRLRRLIEKIESLTESGKLHWERQVDSAHRYARLNNNLLILGPAQPLGEAIPRYLFITPFDSPDCIEINTSDPELGGDVSALVQTVEARSAHEPPTDPFSVAPEIIERLTE
jgi:hypothetical protein